LVIVHGDFPLNGHRGMRKKETRKKEEEGGWW
jgi:hypothetical protein